MQRVLITGGSGQVGSALRAQAPSEYTVLAPDSATLDISDSSSVASAFDRLRPQWVINAAAFTAVDKAETDRARAFAVNAVGAGNLARACNANGVPLVHLSTDYVFDGRRTSAYVETDSTNPLSVYGASKLDGEREVVAAAPCHLILRVSWVFSSSGNNFVKTMLRLADQETLRVVGDQRGTPSAAADIASVIWSSAGILNSGQFKQVLHFSSSPATTWFGFAAAVFETARALGILTRVPRLQKISSEEYPSATRRPANSVLDSSRLSNLLAFKPPDWRVSLRKVLEDIRDDAQRNRAPG